MAKTRRKLLKFGKNVGRKGLMSPVRNVFLTQYHYYMSTAYRHAFSLPFLSLGKSIASFYCLR